MLYTKSHKKLIPLYILNILREYTDFNHHLKQQEIVSLLKKDFSIECERKAVARNIGYLVDAGFDICNDRGYYLAGREFDDCEIRLIIDSLLFSRHIPNKQCHELIKKLIALSNRSFKNRSNYVNISKNCVPQNKQLFYTVEILDQAISEKKQVEFIYNNYGTDKKLHPKRKVPYIVDPYQMVFSNGQFYLICNYNKYNGLLHLKIDRITDIKIMGKYYKNPAGFNNFDLPKYMAEHIYMMPGDSTTVKFRIPKSIIGDVLDWFGNCEFSNENNIYCDVKVNVNINAMLHWSLQYGPYVEIIEPIELRKKIGDLAQIIADKYKSQGFLEQPQTHTVVKSYKNAYVKATL